MGELLALAEIALVASITTGLLRLRSPWVRRAAPAGFGVAATAAFSLVWLRLDGYTDASDLFMMLWTGGYVLGALLGVRLMARRSEELLHRFGGGVVGGAIC